MPSCNLDASSIFLAGRALVDVLKNTGRAGFKADQNPSESGGKHRFSLLVSKKLCLNKPTKPPLNTPLFLRVADHFHELDHFTVHIELIIIEHHAAHSIFVVELDEFSNNVLACPHPHAAKGWRLAPTAKTTLERT